jgi:hypothetical protein
VVVQLGLSYWASEGIRAGMPAHYVGHKPGILDIFSKYSLKITRICLNMLEYTRIFPCRAGTEVYRARRAGGRTDNLGFSSPKSVSNLLKSTVAASPLPLLSSSLACKIISGSSRLSSFTTRLLPP